MFSMDYTNYFDYFDDVKAYVMDELIHRMQVDIEKPANAKLLQRALFLSELHIVEDGSGGAPTAVKVLSGHSNSGYLLDE